MKPELLAPAGDMKSLYAAISAGADAVYLGGKFFGARAFSNNFDKDELKEAVFYAHLYDVKVYVTVNTLIYDNEVNACLDYLKYLLEIGVDAVIMQDLGMIDLARKVLPDLEIHISTQAHIHNLEGAKFLEKLGIKRTVLARETTIDEIRKIKNNSNIDLEVFIAGALCISYSGNCLMSSLIGGRSGNRGMCAGSCRLPYSLVDDKGNYIKKNEYLLSAKDLASLDNIGSLIDLGIKSFKIEGRMKSSEYVYIITSLYRRAIDSYLKTGKVIIDNNDINNLKKVFNRSLTKGFLFNEENSMIVNTNRPNHQGVEIGKVILCKDGYVTLKLKDALRINDGIRFVSSKDEGFIVTAIYKNRERINEAFKNDIVSLKTNLKIKEGSIVLKTKDSLLINHIQDLIKIPKKLKVDLEFKATLKGMTLKLIYKDFSTEVTSDKVSKAINQAITKEEVLKRLSKLGDTPYEIANNKIDLEDNLFINIKDLNELRRAAINKLNEERLIIKSYKEGTYDIELPDYPEENNISIKTNNINILPKVNYTTLYTENIDLYEEKGRYIIPRVNIDYPKVSRVEVNDIGALNVYKDVYTGPYMNATNSYTVAFLHSIGVKQITLSYEMTYHQVKRLVEVYHARYNKHPNLEVVAYGRIEAMVSKYDMLKAYGLTGTYYLEDKFKNKFPIKKRDDKMVIEYYEKRLDTSDYYSVGINNIRYDIENEQDLNEIKFIMKK